MHLHVECVARPYMNIVCSLVPPDSRQRERMFFTPRGGWWRDPGTRHALDFLSLASLPPLSLKAVCHLSQLSIRVFIYLRTCPGVCASDLCTCTTSGAPLMILGQTVGGRVSLSLVRVILRSFSFTIDSGRVELRVSGMVVGLRLLFLSSSSFMF